MQYLVKLIIHLYFFPWSVRMCFFAFINHIKDSFNHREIIRMTYLQIILGHKGGKQSLLMGNKKIKMASLIHFKVRCHTFLRENVVIVGNVPELGNWSVAHGVELTTSEETYPLWYGTIKLDLEPYESIEFKIVKRSEYQTIWEEVANRIVGMNYSYMSVFLTFNHSHMKVKKLKSFFDQLETLITVGAKRRPIRSISPLDDDDDDESSIDFSDAGSDLNSLFDNLSEMSTEESIPFHKYAHTCDIE